MLTMTYDAADAAHRSRDTRICRLLTESYRVLPSFFLYSTEFYPVVPSFRERFRVLPSCTQFDPVFPSFTEVSPSFTGFFLAWLEFIGFLHSLTGFYLV